MPHGLLKGASVTIGASGTISEANGNTAANGTFTITVLGPTSFSLDGSAGNGNWTGGGVVTATGLQVTNARSALLARRPEIQYIALDCANTNVTVPYIDVANEILEAVVAPPTSPVTTPIGTDGTSAERRALPQNLSQAAYTNTAGVVFPLGLPFDLPFAQTQAYCAALGVTRAACLKLIAAGASAISEPVSYAIAGASRGINPEMQTVITTKDLTDPWMRWGFSASSPKCVIDPTTRQPYSPNPSNWFEALRIVPVLLNRAGLSLQQLYQLLEVTWVTQNTPTNLAVTLQPGIKAGPNNVQVLDPSTDNMTFGGTIGLTGDVLDRANRFLRLWSATGLKMWELDWAIAQWAAAPAQSGVSLDDLLSNDFLVFLSDAIAVRAQLNLPFQEVLSFWGPMGTVDVTSHLGDEDAVVPSTYTEVFRNPTVLAAWSAVFVQNGQTLTAVPVVGASNTTPIAITTATPHGLQTGAQVTVSGVVGNAAANGVFTISVTSPTTFSLGAAGTGVGTGGTVAPTIVPLAATATAAESANLNAVTAALGLGASDILAIPEFAAGATLTLDTLNVLLRYSRLSKALSLNVADLVTWIQLTAKHPFGAALGETLEFLRRLAVLQGTGIAVRDLDYLLRHQSVSQSALAFTTTQSTAVLQTVRNGIANLPTSTPIVVIGASFSSPSTVDGASSPVTIVGASNATPIAITTATPHGLQTGVQVTISGVEGNTAANGMFTISVTSPTAFTLVGTAGTGTGTGGTVTSDIIITTASPHGLQTGAQVTISGVQGNTAANGTFTIRVTGTQTFTLDGVVGNAAWTGEGSVSADILITTAAPHGLQTGMQVTINGVQGNTAANGTFTVNVTGPTTFFLDEVCGATAWTSGGVVIPLISIVAASNTSPIAITTQYPHGLQTGLEVTVSGVPGNTAANGAFAVTVTSTTTFTLNDSIGNGLATPGGIASVSRALTIQTIVIQALAAATNVSANVVTVALLQTSAAPIDAATIGQLLAQPASVDPSLFPTLVNAFTAVAKAAALFASLKPTESEFAFLVSNASTFNWINPAALPTAAVSASPYLAFERLLRALQIDRRQPARGCRLFDLFSQWTTPGQLPADVPTAIGKSFAVTGATHLLPVAISGASGPSTVISASNTSPIVLTTAAPHGLQSGMQVIISGVQGNTTANGVFTISALGATLLALNGSTGNGAWTTGGTVTSNILITTATAHSLQTGSQVTISGVQGCTAANGVFTVSVMTPTTFTLDGSTGNAAYTTGGTVAADILITTAAPHGLQTGMQVAIEGVLGNLAANGVFTILVASPTTFFLDGAAGTDNWTSGGTVTPTVTLVTALNASMADTQAIATALNAQAPSLDTTTQAGTLCDIAMLTAVADVLDVLRRYHISGATLVVMAAIPADPNAAAAAMGAFQAQYSPSDWFGAVQPVEDALRESRRDALVAYLLGGGASALLGDAFLTTDDIFNYFLIDPEMSACAATTRLLQAALAIQQFVQQCFLALPMGVVVNTTVTPTTTAWEEWSWRQQYRLWQANRSVFLYPENYLLPETRSDASPIFSDLVNDLRQTNCDADAAEAAIESYLRSLVGLSSLTVAAHCLETKGPGLYVLHVFARTPRKPYQWYYRTRTGSSPGCGAWGAWNALNLTIASDHLLPVIWDQRLHLLWPVFKSVNENQNQQPQTVPPSSGGGQSPPTPTFWAIEFSLSEFSAGQWQPAQNIDQNVFVRSIYQTLTSDQPNPYMSFPPLSFTFLAYQDTYFNLQVSVYFQCCTINLDLDNPDFDSANFAFIYGDLLNFSGSWYPQLVAVGTIQQPDTPFLVTQSQCFRPGSVDLSQEPTFASVQYAQISTTTYNASGGLIGELSFPSCLNPQSYYSYYGYSGQDIILGNYGYVYPPGFTSGTFPSQPINQLQVLEQSNSSVAQISLFGSITNPRIVFSQQEQIFGSSDPFFVADVSRTYLVIPELQTLSASSEPLDGVPSGSTEYMFQSFYHPYARTFLRELEIGGVSQLMARCLQLNPQTIRGWGAPSNSNFDFNAIYIPTSYVASPVPGALSASEYLPYPTLTSGDPGETALDFDPACGGSYSLYNWEIFYHVPMFVASSLMQNQQYQEAMNWLEYIFNPTDSSGGQTPQRFWEMAPFNAMQAVDWSNQDIQNLVTQDMETANVAAWMAEPFDPDVVAQGRIAAYAKATVMKFLDNLIAWGDSLYSQYTAETVSQAEQLYILADMILGPAPQELRLPSDYQTIASQTTYATLQALGIDQFSDALVNIENIIVAPTPPQAVVDGTASMPTLPYLPLATLSPSNSSVSPAGASASTLLFCIPPNGKLLAYWGTVAQRLYNIRHCLNMQGVPQPLPMYGPPLNPLQLEEALAGGGSASGASSTAPIYRFTTYLQRAVELANDVRAYGASVLAALEKKDAETLAALRASQEVDIQTRMLDVKTGQVTEAQDQIAALQNEKLVVQVRYNFYSNIAFMNDWEIAAIALQAAALIGNGVAVVSDMLAAPAHLVPTFSVGVAGFGGTPSVNASFGGENIASAATSFATAARGIAGLLSEAGGMASTMGSYQRRQDEWTLQANIASADLTQMDSQIAAANDRLAIANSELSIQNVQINNAQAISDFLTSKFTNAQLYDWMLTQLTAVHTQAYQLAYNLSQQAQTAFQYQLGSTETFVQPGYWDSLHKGLTAGDSLLFDLRRMEARYLAENTRELELTKHVSMALTQPINLIQLIATGTCPVYLDEALFDADHPGHYFRRLRSVALTIPCVAGPYTGVNASLTLATAITRSTNTLPSTGYQPARADNPPSDPNTFIVANPGTMICTSSGQNDAGLFEVNLHDERWLPFEGQGAISAWALTLDPQDNAFDVSTITDVVLHLRYTARSGIEPQAVRSGIKSPADGPLQILVSVRNTFGDAYYAFFNPTNTAATGPTTATLTLNLTLALFPFSNLGTPTVNDIVLYFELTSKDGAANFAAAGANYTINGAAAPQPSFTPVTDASGNPTAYLSGDTGVNGPVTATAPLAFRIDVTSPMPPAEQVDDILALISYTL